MGSPSIKYFIFFLRLLLNALLDCYIPRFSFLFFTVFYTECHNYWIFIFCQVRNVVNLVFRDAFLKKYLIKLSHQVFIFRINEFNRKLYILKDSVFRGGIFQLIQAYLVGEVV